MAWSDLPARTPSLELVRLVRGALTHLYDIAYLENHRLASLLDTGGKLDHLTRAQRLRRTLLDCLEALRPQGTEEIGLEASRAYAILTYRYVDGMAMEDIAARRALSERQAYRELERGLEAIATLLEERIGTLRDVADHVLSPGGGAPADQLQVVRVEVARLGQSVRTEAFAPAEVVQGVLAMLAPVLVQVGGRVEVTSPANWPLVVADRVMFRQAMLNLLTYASRVFAPGAVRVTAVEDGGMLTIVVAGGLGSPTGHVHARSEDDAIRLGVARSLVEAQGGQFETQPREGDWLARIRFRIAARQTILVVDDNQDLIALFQRYVAGRDLTVIGTHDSRQAGELAAERQPALITVDVMMPSLDGWDLLQRLKATPLTAHIPVIVCSVLHEPELARGMGASDYLTKPVQQADLLAVLARHLARPTPAT